MQDIDVGKVGEYQFATELLKLGYVPLWPSTETVPYDLGFWNGTRLIRVQVKASKQKKAVELDVGTRVHSKRIKYDETHMDVLVVWAIEHNLWYIIPVKNLTTRSMNLNPTGKRCKWRSFKEAWHLLK